MLDYGFIEGCSDVKLLHDIVSVLKSGKEGYYPDVKNAFIISVVASKYQQNFNDCIVLLHS